MSWCGNCWSSCPLKNTQLVTGLIEKLELIDWSWNITNEWKKALEEKWITPCNWCIEKVVKILNNRE